MEDETTTTWSGAAGAAHTKAGKSSHEAGCSARAAGETAGRPIDNGFTGMQGDADACQGGLGPYYHNASITMTPMEPGTRNGRVNQQRDRENRPDQGDNRQGWGQDRHGHKQSKRVDGRKSKACWGCGGRHKLSACTSTTSAMKERIWKLLKARDEDPNRAAAKAMTSDIDGAVPTETKAEEQGPLKAGPSSDGAEADTKATAGVRVQMKSAGSFMEERKTLEPNKVVIPWREICGRCMSRNHRSGDCTAPPKCVYNPGYWAKQEGAAAAADPASSVAEPRLWRDRTVESEATGRCVLICGRCLERGHSVYACTAPMERVYNPGYWAIHEPAIREEVERQGKRWGAGGVNWEDPDWQLPPVPNEEAESDDTDSEVPTLTLDGDKEF